MDTEKELSRINTEAETINIQVKDYDGNSTKWFGLNDKAAITALKKFLDQRMKKV